MSAPADGSEKRLDPYEILLTYAEVGVALAGFGGIVAAFRQQQRELSPRDIGAVRFVVEVSLSAIFFAVTPAVLSNFDVAPSSTWRISALLLAIGLLGLFVVQERRRRRVGRALGERLPTVKARPWMVAAYLAISAFVGIAGILDFETTGVYLIGTGLLLTSAGIEFLVFVAELQAGPQS